MSRRLPGIRRRDFWQKPRMNKLTLSIKVRSLQKARRDNLQLFQRRLREAKQRGAGKDETDSIGADHGPEDSLYEAEIYELWTRFLRERTEQLLLPLPPIDDELYWQKSQFISGWLLTIKGVDEVRRSIRNEQQERRATWFSWLAAFTGLIGALSGLAAVLSSSL